jgi:hypothetical protein
MKKVIITIALTFLLTGCKKSNTELQIEHYELQKVKLEYLRALLKTKEDLSCEKRQHLIDSLITEEKIKLENESN